MQWNNAECKYLLEKLSSAWVISTENVINCSNFIIQAGSGGKGTILEGDRVDGSE